MNLFKISVSLLLISNIPAYSADLATLKSPVTAPPSYLWNGLYAGLNAGGTLANNSAVNSTTWNVYQPASNADLTLSALLSGSGSGPSGNAGFIGGGQIGYSSQMSFRGINLVTGGEADIQGIAASGGNGSRWIASNTDNFGNPVSLLSNQKVNTSLSYLGTVRTRFGWLPTPALLVYGTGGLAYGGVNATVENAQLWTTTGGAQAGQNSVMFGNSPYSSTQVGWSAGGGVEWMVFPNVSAKAEYLYYDLGNVSGSIVNNYYGTNLFAGNNGIQNITDYSGRISGNIIRAGVNYHFNITSMPVASK